ncbi:hypothetical protein EBB59_08480 [Lysobacter pythonis]|uniref:LPS-assembly lipoprotein LptE n=1 Tax=Solilutibacter pythonis TaxID=2483112 RepID=A0A3M2HN77_9GAMM|nr:LPS assembly lipoprotein LptE [Lysobacter pythonis]RMH91166.1 hypothetical protein EBB59_08480 [Lysobacter pythonis]
MKKLVLATFVLFLAGCGFHLRRPLDLPMDLGPVRVVSPDPYSPLAESLALALARAGATAPADPDETQGVARLEIVSERWGDTPNSLDQYGRAQEFSLRYAVIFALRDGNGRDVVPQQAVELSRDYVAPAADAIGKASERELLSKEMRREMTTAILRRVAVATRTPQPPPEDFSTEPKH